MGDDVYLEFRVGVVLADLFDQGVQLSCRDDVVLPPVVRKDVVAANSGRRGVTELPADVAAFLLERLDDRAIKVRAEQPTE